MKRLDDEHAGLPPQACQRTAACRAVHDDVFKVIKYSFDETLGAEMATRCTQLWCTFVEPMFGLPARPLHQTEKVQPNLPSQASIRISIETCEHAHGSSSLLVRVAVAGQLAKSKHASHTVYLWWCL